MLRNAVAVPPTAPNVETIANPMEPQLHAPALAPMIEPKKPELDLRKLERIRTSLYILMLMTSPDRAETITINEKLKKSPSGT